jgi:small multidrug resistance pump
MLAILSEVVGTICMKHSQGFSKIWPSLAVFPLYGVSLAALVMALKKIDLSMAYAIWSGVGTALIAVVGILWFEEPAGMLKVASLIAIVVGVVGLKISG